MEAVPRPPARIADVAARAGVGRRHRLARRQRPRRTSPTATRAAGARGDSRARVPAELGRPEPLAQAHARDRRRAAVPDEPSPIERVRGIVTALASSPYDLALYDVESADRQRARVPPARRRPSHRRPARRLADPAGRGGAAAARRIDPVRAHRCAARRAAERRDRRRRRRRARDAAPARARASPHRVHRRQAGRPLPLPVEPRPDASGTSAPSQRPGSRSAPEYVREGTQSRHVARSIADELLRLPEPPTAVFAASDVQALGVLEAARALGIDVPGQLSVIGFDDIEIASYVGLTTVRQRLFESGRRGAELLLGTSRRRSRDAHGDAAARARRAQDDAPAAVS